MHYFNMPLHMCFGDKYFVTYITLMTLAIVSLKVHITVNFCTEFFVTQITLKFFSWQCHLWISRMHIFGVCFIVNLAFECPSTMFTHEWPFISVAQLMFIERCIGGKAFATNLTHVVFALVAATVKRYKTIQLKQRFSFKLYFNKHRHILDMQG